MVRVITLTLCYRSSPCAYLTHELIIIGRLSEEYLMSVDDKHSQRGLKTSLDVQRLKPAIPAQLLPREDGRPRRRLTRIDFASHGLVLIRGRGSGRCGCVRAEVRSHLAHATYWRFLHEEWLLGSLLERREGERKCVCVCVCVCERGREREREKRRRRKE